MASNDPNTYFSGGQRFAPASVDLDVVAQAMGYPDFATFQAADPQGATSVLYQYGDPSQGQFNQQVATSDDLNTGRLAMLLAAAAVPWGGYGAAGAAGGTAADTAPALLSTQVPTQVGIGSGGALASGAYLPTATLSAAPVGATAASTAPQLLSQS